MTKYINRLRARLAREVLRESAKNSNNWIVSKKLILETEEGDLELEPGDSVEMGGTEDGDLALASSAAVVVISDEDLAKKIADVVVSSDELSDVKFVEKPALDAVLDGEEVDDAVDKLADDDDENIEVAELDVENEKPAEEKFDDFAENVIKCDHPLICESILIDENAKNTLNMAIIKKGFTVKESLNDYSKFIARVSELKGSIQPGEREIALTESGKVMGAFNKKAENGFLFLENEFDSEEDMNAFDDSDEPLMQEADFEYDDFSDEEIEDMDNDYLDSDLDFDSETSTDVLYTPEQEEKIKEIVNKYDFSTLSNAYESNSEADECTNELEAYAIEDSDFAEKFKNDTLANIVNKYHNDSITNSDDSELELDNDYNDIEDTLGEYEESAKSGKDYITLVNGLRKAHLKESCIAKIVSTFDNKSLKECVRVFDTKYGKYVAAFKESVDCDNFIAEANENKRFTKRFFA